MVDQWVPPPLDDREGPTADERTNSNSGAILPPRREKRAASAASPPHFRLTITLEEQPAGALVPWEQAFDEDAVANAVRPIVEPANGQDLDRLSAEVHAGA